MYVATRGFGAASVATCTSLLQLPDLGASSGCRSDVYVATSSHDYYNHTASQNGYAPALPANPARIGFAIRYLAARRMSASARIAWS